MSTEPPVSPESPPDPVAHSRVARLIWLLAGYAFVALAFAGILLPVLPTTPFLILAAGCFARSSPRLERWLMNHPRFGPHLREWRDRGAIPRRAKYASAFAMTAGFAAFWFLRHPPLWQAGLILALMGAGAAYVWTRPE